MAMRPEVKQRGLALIGLAILQYVAIWAIVFKELIPLSTDIRVALYTTSVIICGTVIFLSLIYMAIKGNADN